MDKDRWTLASSAADLLMRVPRGARSEGVLTHTLAELLSAIQLNRLLDTLEQVASGESVPPNSRASVETTLPKKDQSVAPRKRRDLTGRRGTSGPGQAADALRTGALRWLEQRVGAQARRLGRGQSYAFSGGTPFCLRVSSPTPRNHGERSYWFGIKARDWNLGEIAVFVCGTDGMIIIPFDDLEPYRTLIPMAKGDTEYQPSIWGTADGRLELHAGHERVELTSWRDRVDLFV